MDDLNRNVTITDVLVFNKQPISGDSGGPVGINFLISVFVITGENTKMVGVGFTGDAAISAKMSAYDECRLKYTLGVAKSDWQV